MASRVLLLIPTTSYKATDFMEAAGRLRIEVAIGAERRQALQDEAPGRTLAADFVDTARGLAAIRAFARETPLDAVLGVDDETVELAALAARELGLPHNPPAAVRAARDKLATREHQRAAGLRTPAFRTIPLAAGTPDGTASSLTYPGVLKPRALGASRGVLRVDDAKAFHDAVQRIRRLLQRPDVRRRGLGLTDDLLFEEYIPGDEVALEGLLRDGELRSLALFDKPDPLTGPTFEETLFVTPSRLGPDVRRAIEHEAAAACRALGLREGPVHAELRVRDGVPWLLEVAPRTIGGLCARALRFGSGVSLEELVLRHAVGRETAALDRERSASGVMMIPVPAAGVLRRVRGLERAGAVPGVVEVTLSVHRGTELEPLPEGHRYVGFIFARGDGPREVETALRSAHAELQFEIDARGG
jgi:biotin carboxylase